MKTGAFLGSRRLRTNECLKLPISAFRKYFSHKSMGSIKQRYTYRGEEKEKILFFLLDAKKNHFWVSQEIQDFRRRYKINLIKNPCQYGGFRYWFSCPHCSRRATKLFYPITEGALNSYLCRRCLKLSYQSRNISKGVISWSHWLEDKTQKEINECRSWYYKGKLTKRHQRVIRHNKRLEWLDNRYVMRLSRLFG